MSILHYIIVLCLGIILGISGIGITNWRFYAIVFLSIAMEMTYH